MELAAPDVHPKKKYVFFADTIKDTCVQFIRAVLPCAGIP